MKILANTKALKIYLFFCFTFFLCVYGRAQDDVPVFLHFDEWPIVQLSGGILACSEYHTEFEDNFTFFNPLVWDKFDIGDEVKGRFHSGAPATIFTDDRVTIENDNSGNPQYLALTVGEVTTPYRLQNPDNSNFDAHGLGSVPYVERNATAGMVHLNSDILYFNLGKYEIKCKFPNKANAWQAFWMWHHDEIDIFDIAFRGGFGQGVSKEKVGDPSKRYSATIINAPCCSEIRDCDFCSANSVFCGLSEECTCPNDIYQCEYLAEEFHIVGCEWTPFKIRFYVDDITTGTIYRYHYFDKNPVDVDCGDNIPEGLVRENPVFTEIENRAFTPQIWITATPQHFIETPISTDCDYASCPVTEINDLPATLLVDYVTIQERIYERVNIKLEDCDDLCGSQNPICVERDNEFYNFHFDGIWEWHTHPAALPPYPEQAAFVNWDITSNNATLTLAENDHACFNYNGNNDPVSLLARLQMQSGDIYTLSKVFESPTPKIYHNSLENGSTEICIEYCGDYQITVNGEILDTQGDFACYITDCIDNFALSYSDCGTPTVITESCESFIVTPQEINSCEGYALFSIEGDYCMAIEIVDAYLLDGANHIVPVEYVLIDDELYFDFEGEYLIYSIHFSMTCGGGSTITNYDFDISVCDECCPEGSAFDGANCYFGLHYLGVTGYIENNGFYTTANELIYPMNFGCPPLSTYVSPNKCFWEEFPSLYDGFIFNNTFYTNSVCDPCCPFGMTFIEPNDICFYDVDFYGVQGFVDNNTGRFYTSINCSLFYTNNCCPPGSYRINDYCYYPVTFVPSEYQGYAYNGDFYTNAINCTQRTNLPSHDQVLERSLYNYSSSASSVSFIIYPNPFSENFTIQSSNESLVHCKMEIANISGSVVYTKELEFAGSNQTQITPELRPGIYFVKIYSNNFDQYFKIVSF